LNFDGTGYPAKDKMSPVEIALDSVCGMKTNRACQGIDKHRSFPRKDTRVFRMKLREAEDDMRKLNLRSSRSPNITARNTSRIAVRSRRPGIPGFHRRGSPANPGPPARLHRADRSAGDEGRPKGALATFNYVLQSLREDGPMLRASGHSLLSFYRRLSAPPQPNRPPLSRREALRAGT